MFDKSQFPTLEYDPSLAYFDSAATSQTHQTVLDVMNDYYTAYRASPGRSIHRLGEEVDIKISWSREQVAKLINTPVDHILFTSGTTQGLNWIADWNKNAPVVIITEAEHHANIIPWLQQGRNQENGRLKVIPMLNDGTISIDDAISIIKSCPEGSLVSIIATSNVTGINQPWEQLAKIAHENGCTIAVDFCQTVAHSKIDLQKTNIDWAVFSAHKMYGPTGVGALYTSKDVNELEPVVFGGGAVDSVTFDKVVFTSGPERHEPGTPNVASIIGFGEAARLINEVGYAYLEGLEMVIANTLINEGILEIDNLKLVIADQTISHNSSILSFVTNGFHSSDIGTLLSHTNVAVRTGKLCAHPYVDKFSTLGVVRVSIAPYNTIEDCKILVSSLKKAASILS